MVAFSLEDFPVIEKKYSLYTFTYVYWDVHVLRINVEPQVFGHSVDAKSPGPSVVLLICHYRTFSDAEMMCLHSLQSMQEIAIESSCKLTSLFIYDNV